MEAGLRGNDGKLSSSLSWGLFGLSTNTDSASSVSFSGFLVGDSGDLDSASSWLGSDLSSMISKVCLGVGSVFRGFSS